MTGLWFCYGLLIIGLLYYVSYDVFLGEVDNSVVVENNRTADIPMEYNAVSATSLHTRSRWTSTRTEEPNKVNRATDIFDYCPFEPPDPWHKSILKHMEVKYGYLKDCTPDSNLSPVTDLVKGKVVLKKGKEAFTCQARCVNYAGDNQYKLGDWKSIEDEVNLDDIVAIKKLMESDGTKHNKWLFRSSTNTTLNRQKNPDVVIMVIDSVASTQLIRGLPRTVNFLLHGMEAIEFRKLNKVGSNSRPNAFPALIGKTTEAVPRKPMNLPTIPADLSYEQYCRSYLDNESYVPLMYKKAGYKMFGAEDYVTSILNYPNCLGTKTRQFEHSYRPFHTILNKDKELGKIHLGGSCRLVHDNMLEYLEHFVNAYKDSPKFSFTWFVDLAHDNTKLIYRSDYELYNFYLKNREALNNSFIFFFGDHGPRFGSEAYTKFGNSEANNPFLYVVLPKHLRHTELHKQILANSKELVTHHDLHSTFEDILYNQPSANFSDRSFKRFDSDLRGSSLLRQFESGVPRTCKTLPIPFQYCICQYKKKNVTDGKLAEALGAFAVEKLAAILESEKVASSCEKIALSNVIEALEFVLPHKNDTQFEVHLYEVTFAVTAPALGTFKIPIRKESRGKFELAGEQFDRLDKYGKHGDCMTKDILRPLCTCKMRRAS